jgi:hypothetical protein
VFAFNLIEIPKIGLDAALFPARCLGQSGRRRERHRQYKQGDCRENSFAGKHRVILFLGLVKIVSLDIGSG